MLFGKPNFYVSSASPETNAKLPVEMNLWCWNSFCICNVIQDNY